MSSSYDLLDLTCTVTRPWLQPVVWNEMSDFIQPAVVQATAIRKFGSCYVSVALGFSSGLGERDGGEKRLNLWVNNSVRLV